MISQGLPPLLCPAPRLLILGSLPGQASIKAQGYYQHPRNAFWPILMAWLSPDDQAINTGPAENSQIKNGPEPGIQDQARSRLQKHEILQKHGIALWDVLAEAYRPGSLDSSIHKQGKKFNQLQPLLTQDSLRGLIFNGQAAWKHWQQGCKQGLFAPRPELRLITLPSTSPAHASLTLTQKQQQWHQALDSLLSK